MSPNHTDRKSNRNSSLKQKHSHFVVQHNYHDHANDSPSSTEWIVEARNAVNVPFPIKLFDMLESVQEDGTERIVSWQPHGRCFVVHKPEEFVEILPRYFKLSKIASFQRQLNLYGFTRITQGPDKGGYYHECFLRGKPWLLQSIHRVRIKGTGVRARANPAQEPTFWSMPWIKTTPAATANTCIDSEDEFDDFNCGRVSCTSSPFCEQKPQHELEESLEPIPVSSMTLGNDATWGNWSKPPEFSNAALIEPEFLISSCSSDAPFEIFDFCDDSESLSEDFDDLVEQLFTDNDGNPSFSQLLESAVVA